ncbi:dystrobrevin binding protein 1b isoform X1 [Electrophorus electricus]|nr:dystrobrevin binding protein 1b isoform X1 [Electrophorus electricus]
MCWFCPIPRAWVKWEAISSYLTPPCLTELDLELAQRVPEVEPGQQQVKLKDRQKCLEETFHQDMENYLSTGYLQIAERREPIGSMSSMEVNVDMLEQMDLIDMSDHEALDMFLNSGGEDNIAVSPMTAPDVESFTTEITLQVPTQAELRHKLSSRYSTCTDSASQDNDGGGGGGSGVDKEERRADVPGAQLVSKHEKRVHADPAQVQAEQQNQPIKNCANSDSSGTQAQKKDVNVKVE